MHVACKYGDHLVVCKSVKSSHSYSYSAFHNTDCIKAASQ